MSKASPKTQENGETDNTTVTPTVTPGDNIATMSSTTESHPMLPPFGGRDPRDATCTTEEVTPCNPWLDVLNTMTSKYDVRKSVPWEMEGWVRSGGGGCSKEEETTTAYSELCFMHYTY